MACKENQLWLTDGSVRINFEGEDVIRISFSFLEVKENRKRNFKVFLVRHTLYSKYLTKNLICCYFMNSQFSKRGLDIQLTMTIFRYVFGVNPICYE